MSAVPAEDWTEPRQPRMKVAPHHFLCIVRDRNEKTVAQYELVLPLQGQRGHATQSQAFNQFRDMETARSQGSPLRRCTFTPWEWAQEIKLVRTECRPVKSIWALFKSIDYDPKTGTYK